MNAKFIKFCIAGFIVVLGVNVNANEVKIQTPEHGQLQDLTLLAKAKGWSLDAARAHVRAADAVGAVAVAFSEKYPELFVGSEVSSDPYGAPSLYIKGQADQKVYTLLGEQRVMINVVDNQPYSFAELEAFEHQVHAILAEEGFDNFATMIDFRSPEKVQALITMPKNKPLGVASIQSLLPASIRDRVAVMLSAEPVAVDFDAFGGMLARDDGVGECTSGWSVVNGVGTTGVTTAGHCTGINQFVHGATVHAATHVSEHRGQWGDIEWKTTATTEPARFYATSASIRTVTSVEPRAGISIGESVCFYGRFSNSRDCSLDVSATSVSCTVSGVSNNRLVRMNGNSAIPGDSGGGWSWNNKAYGSVKGICGGGAVWSVADLYDEAIGVSVRI